MLGKDGDWNNGNSRGPVENTLPSGLYGGEIASRYDSKDESIDDEYACSRSHCKTVTKKRTQLPQCIAKIMPK